MDIRFGVGCKRLSVGFDSDLFNRFTQTLQRVPGMARGLQHLVDLGAGDITRVDAADAFALQVDLEHDLGRRFAVLAKKLLDDLDVELHGGEVGVELHDLKHLRRLDTLGAPFQHHRVVAARSRRCSRGIGLLGNLSDHAKDSSGGPDTPDRSGHWKKPWLSRIRTTTCLKTILRRPPHEKTAEEAGFQGGFPRFRG